MANSTIHQLMLLADDIKLSLLERQRASSLRLDASKQDTHISRSLTSLQKGIDALEAQHHDLDLPEDSDSDLSRLRQQYADLDAQFHGSAPTTTSVRRPNDPSLQPDFDAVPKKVSTTPHTQRNKSVRFRDNPNEEDPEDVANRNALFAEQERYRDDPEGPPDQSHLDNQQIHAYHKQVLRDQDEQLETLGQSIGRQRMLGIQIGDELTEHNEMLDDVERGVDRHQSTLDRARRRLEDVARRGRQNWNWITIGVLVCILVLLIIVLK